MTFSAELKLQMAGTVKITPPVVIECHKTPLTGSEQNQKNQKEIYSRISSSFKPRKEAFYDISLTKGFVPVF